MPARAAPTTSSNAPRRIRGRSSARSTIESPLIRRRTARPRASCSFGCLANETRMTRVRCGRPFRRDPSPKKFEPGEHEQGLAGREEEGCGHVARPMRAEINARISNERGDDPVKPAAPIEKREAERYHGVV